MRRRLAATISIVAVIALTYALQSPSARAPTVARESSGGASLSSLDGALDPGTAISADPASVAGPDGRRSLDDQIAFWAARADTNPRDFLSLLQLAMAEASKARLSADLELYQRADAVLARAAGIVPGYPQILIAQTSIRLALHDFAAAERIARGLVDRDEGDATARALLGDALVQLGDYQGATQNYARLAALVSGPAVDARLARLAFVAGDGSRALSLAEAARDEAGDDPGAPLGFYHFQLGEMARLQGRPDLAGPAYEAALATNPRDLGSLLGLARVEAFDGRVDDAIGLLRRATAIAPQPDSLALLGDLLGLRGQRQAAADSYATVRTIRQLSQLQGGVYDRQLLMFELDHGGASADVLARARVGLAAQPDIYGHDTLAWALYRLGEFPEAETQITAALATGCPDARLLYHAGAISLALGEAEAGQAQLERALAIRGGLDPLQRAEAEALLARAEGSNTVGAR